MNLVPVPVEIPGELLDLLKRVAGPAADEIGLGLRDSLRMMRAERQLRFLQRWRTKLAEAKIEPQAVRLPLLFDIFAGASLEGDEELQDMWANLLANAADPNYESLIANSFPHILRQLSKQEAGYLNEMFEVWLKAEAELLRYEPEPDSFSHKLDPVYYDNLMRERLIEGNEETVPAVAVTASDEERKRWPSGYKPLTDERYFLTSLGIAFVKACRTPKSRESRPDGTCNDQETSFEQSTI